MPDCNIFLNFFILLSLVISVRTQTSDACGGVRRDDKGVITSPNFPGIYPPNQLCIWKIETPIRCQTLLHFTHFDVEGTSGDCEHDSVQIRSESELFGKYCGSDLPFDFVSGPDDLLITFVSDKSIQKRGFSVRYFTDCDGNVDAAIDSTDVSFQTTTERYSTETDWYTTEKESITSLSQNPLTHPVNSNSGSAVSPFSNSQSARETSPVSNTALYPKYLPASPRNYLDISINFPFGQRWPEQDTPLPNDRKPIQNQGMGSVPDYLKSKPSSGQSERGYDLFSVDTKDRNVRKSDEELSSRYADASYSQNNYAPRPVMTLFLFPNSYPINIRVNG